ncbi:MAG: MFS transporter [Gammaproteobacteria bacterium]|nr:MFS transporter [Gammaproteobacteria bacterium]
MQPTVTTFRGAVGATWALLLGFTILSLGDGLQGTLLAVRAFQEGFATTTTGLVMSAFYAGFLGGSLWTPRIVPRVGHIRVFAALAAVASAIVLIHAVFLHPAMWLILRLTSGFCFAGLYIVAESWLNDRAVNETRGQLLSLYMVLTYIAVGTSQFFLNLSDTQGYPLFILTSVLISVAVVPLLISASPAPRFEEAHDLKLRELYRISPLGVVGMFGVGMASAALFSLGPVYASQIALSTAELSYFMAAPLLATVLVQWPIGRISDVFDRRRVLTIISVLAAASAALCAAASAWPLPAIIGTFGLFGGLCLPMYSLCIAHTNDSLAPEQMVAASGGLMLAAGLGAIFGPIAVSFVMGIWGDTGFFWVLAVIHIAIGLFGVYRMFKRKATPLADQGHHAPAVLRPSTRAVESIQEHLRDDFDD